MENNKTNIFNSYDELPLSLNVTQVTSLLNISRGKLYELIQEQGFPAISFGKKYVFPKDKLLEWIKAHTEGTHEV